MKRLKVAFDVDDTLIVPNVAGGFGNNTPNYRTIEIYRWFQEQGHYMIVWSGGGIDWARKWSDKLGLEVDMFPRKGSVEVDIAFDDCDVELGTVNVKVKRINNSVSREEWNKNKE